jgi:hypothetical protein
VPRKPLDLPIDKELFRGDISFFGEGEKPKKKVRLTPAQRVLFGS